MSNSNDEANWKAMYLTLFHGIVEAQKLLPMREENGPASERLTVALRDAEEIYISGK
ncbi:MAG: hypothetical protein IJ396_01435 [Oscillibacter sp.]|nr:hypothetical protein [Oscillibacter sp.]